MANSTRPYQVLRTRRDFVNLKENGKKLRVASWFFATIFANSLDCYRVGFVISRKVGNAVTRNRLRRWGKEYLRKKFLELKSEEKKYDFQILFLPQTADFYKKLQHDDFKTAMDLIFERIKNLK